MEKFFAYISTDGRFDTNIARVWISEDQVSDLLSKYNDVAVFRISTNQMAILPAEYERVVWVDVLTKDYAAIAEWLTARENSRNKRVQNA